MSQPTTDTTPMKATSMQEVYRKLIIDRVHAMTGTKHLHAMYCFAEHILELERAASAGQGQANHQTATEHGAEALEV